MKKKNKQKTKEGFQKRMMKDTKICLKKKRKKGTQMLLIDIEIFLKKKKKNVNNVNMIVNNIKIF